MDIEQYLKELFEFLSIPSISAQSKHNKDVKRAAEFLQGKLSDIDFDAKVLQTEGHPIVYAENLSAGSGKPTVLIYGHYDVQDVGDLDEWTSDPFTPEIRSGNIYARGASDDKGQLYTWIAAIDEILAAHPRGGTRSKNTNKGPSSGVESKLPVNIKFLIEGEEEVGSENLDDFIEENKSLLEADVCVISDTHSLSEDQPMIDYGLRGLVYTEIHIKTLGKDAHSGLYGGNVINPANLLSEIIGKLKDKNHKVKIPGFYENVRELTKKEKKELAKLPFTEKEVKEEVGADVVVGEKKFNVAERAGARPTLDVNGIWAGYQGEGPKTIIPAEAHAKISMRIVPNQTSKEVFERFRSYVKSLIPKGVEYEIKLLAGGEPVIMDINSKYFKTAEAAYKKVFGKKPIYELSGGSIPVTATLKENLGIDSVLMGYGLPDDGLHSPNEKLSVSMFEKGIKTNIEFLKSL